MKAIFWIFFILIVMVYFGYPVFLYVVTLFYKKPVSKKEITPLVTLVIPAHDEESVIDEKMRNTLALDYPKDRMEVIVVSDHSIDKTDEIVKQYEGDGIRLVIQNKRKGKMAALNRVVPQAMGEIVVFSDANTMFDKNAIKKLVQNFNDKKIGCVSGNFSYISNSGPNTGLAGSLYKTYEMSLWAMESQFQSLLVAHGAIYAIRKLLFSYIDDAFADDFVNPLRAAANGYGIVYETEAKATEKVVISSKGEFCRKSRTVSQGHIAFISNLKTMLSCNPIRIAQYILHKLFRWYVPLFLTALFIANAFLLSSAFYLSMFIIQIIFYAFSMLGYWLQKRKIKIMIFHIPFYFCLLNASSLYGLIIALTGKQAGVWEKSEGMV